jgi:type IV pilus assembly protein PilQ
MTVLKAQSQQQGRRILPVRAAVYGLAAGLLSALSAVNAAPPSQQQTPAASPPAVVAPATTSEQAPAVASITNIDFKRGDGGSGKLILRFDRDGAMPDLRTSEKGVVVDIGNATMGANLQRVLNVTDFATPVLQVQSSANANKAQVTLSAKGHFEPMAYQTGREYIVEIMPRATTPARAVGASAATVTGAQRAASSAATPLRTYSGRPVTFNFQDVPVRTVLQLIAEESGLNIVASDTVAGNITLRLINVPWDQALDIVLQAKALDKRRSGNVVWVAPQSEIAKFEQEKEDARIAIENRVEMVTEYIPVSYGNAEDIAKLLTEESKTAQSGGGAAAGGGGGATGGSSRGFLSARGSISFDRRTNTLLVIDIPARVTEIRRLINQLDKPVDQVLIEARIVIANEDFARELGARFGIDDFNSGSSTRVEGNINLPAQASTLITNQPGTLALTFLKGLDLTVELSAMQEEQRGEVISNPRVVTSNQREAIIKQGREIGYVTTQVSAGQITQTVNFKEVVLELRVTPTITNDGRVFMTLLVKKDELEEFIQTINGSVPQIARREVTTAVLVDDGSTVVIGGVYEFNERNDLAKVPFLGDIPVLGNLFKKKTRAKSKAELLIFVTPKVIQVAQRI